MTTISLRPSTGSSSDDHRGNGWISGGAATRRGARARIAEAIFRVAVARMPIRVQLPDGRVWGSGAVDSPVMVLVRPTELFRRLGVDANVGIGEAYQAGDWHSPQLADLLEAFAYRLQSVPTALQGLRIRAQRVGGRKAANTPAQSQRNTAAHYDLSNEMFATFLDASMTYSGAWFDPVDADGDHDLDAAQLRKIDGVLDRAGVTDGSTVMEIGTGWGALSIRAAQRGATVTSLTLSVEQQHLAQARVHAAGLDERVTIVLQDYRAAVGKYDAVVSVEMIEAVGADYWPTYFQTLDGLLKPGGLIALQAITMPHERMQMSRRASTWINKYVFPGGLIPSIEAIETTLADHTTLRVSHRSDHGLDYARTLQHWRERFLANWHTAADSTFDDTFTRTWDYYLAYCEAGFRTGYIGVSVLQLSRESS